MGLTGTGTSTRANASALSYSLVSYVLTVLNRTMRLAAAILPPHALLLRQIAMHTEKIIYFTPIRIYVNALATHPA
jgi:hypothetical protein